MDSLAQLKQQAQQRAAAATTKLQADTALQLNLQQLVEFLPDCEYELVLYMIQKGVWQGFQPTPPSGFKTGDGAIELGLFLYWFHHLDQLNLSAFSLKEKEEIYFVLFVITPFLKPTKMDLANYSFFKTNELIYTDGTVLSTEPYANFDQGWFTAFINMFKSLIDGLWYNGKVFPSTTPNRVALSGKQSDTVTIALLGDWGANNAGSQAVMQHITSLQPDYIVHVGDVYYGGTPNSMPPGATGTYLAMNEEQDNLLNVWPAGYKGKSFTLNSNHEMYSGANGLFRDALTPNTPFSGQLGASCFTMEYGGWTLLGLDSAFNSSVTDAFMTGSIGTPAEFQASWIRRLGLNPKKTIVFTHHNGFADDCTSVSPLWNEIKTALGGDPFAWYWGHVHNGIVYDAPIKIPYNSLNPTLTTNTYARCLGHAALPYGIASHLAGKPIVYQANSAKPAPSKEVYNGFAMLTLTSSAGQLTGITEAFYDVSGKAQPLFSKRLL